MGGEPQLGARLARTCPHCGGREPTLGDVCPLCGRPYEAPGPLDALGGLDDWSASSRGAAVAFVLSLLALPLLLLRGLVRAVVTRRRSRT